MAHVTFPKPSSALVRALDKWEKRQASDTAKRKAKRLHDEAWAKVSAQVSVRDKSTCRVCSCQTTRWGSGNPKTWGAAHHIVYRSAGGLDMLENCIWLCFVCHQREHDHEIDIMGTADDLQVYDFGISEVRGR